MASPSPASTDWRAVALAFVPAAVATGLLAPVAAAVALGSVGTAVLVGGVATTRSRLVRAGTLGLFLGVLTAALAGVPLRAIAVAAVVTAVAWDVADRAVELAGAVGPEGTTWRALVVSPTATLLVAGAVAAVGVAAQERVSGVGPLAVALALLAALFLALAADRA